MSELVRMPELDCVRASGLLPAFADGDLIAAQSAWLETHLEACEECRAALQDFAQVDCELTSWGQHLASRNPPPPGAREQLIALLQAGPARRRPILSITAAAAAIAAVLTMTVAAPHEKAPQEKAPHEKAPHGNPPVSNLGVEPFVAIPYLPPLDPRENTAIVHTNIRVASLLEAGYRIAADPDQVVPADVLVGEDGRAHAVRLPSDLVLN
jgi:hypothetical protein